MPNKKIALLVFAHSVEEELKYKPFLAQNSLATALHKHTITIAHNSGLPVILYDETKQFGEDFGTRFSNALQNVYEAGYDSVIAIGNDCPQLEITHILQAKDALIHNKTAIGPTFDGGFYLLGISKGDFDHSSFIHCNWDKENSYTQVFGLISKTASDCIRLQRLRDIDRYSDIEKFAPKNIRNTVLRNCMLSLLHSNAMIFFTNTLNKLLLEYDIISNKGSPAITSL